MRIAHELTLLATLAIAATASTAPSAFGQSAEPEIHNQAPRLLAAQEVHGAADVACPAVAPTPPPSPSPLVTVGGCRQHYSAQGVALSSHLSAGGTEVVVSTCDLEFDVRLDASGEGWISHQEYTQGTIGTCTRRACAQVTPPTGEGRAWTIYLQETEVAGQGPREAAVILLCHEPIGSSGPDHCELTGATMSQPTTHRYRFTAADVSGHGSLFPHCELSFTLDSEAVLGTTAEGQLEQNVEIRHT